MGVARGAGPSSDGVERFDTGGRTFGWIGLVVSAGLVVVWVVQLATGDALPLPVLAGAVLAGVLFWAAIIRPAVSASPDTLVLRNMLETVHIPLASVEDHALRQVLAVRAGDKKYVASGLGRSLKASALGPKQPKGGGPAHEVDAADFIEARISDLAGNARDRAGIQRYSDEQLALGRTVTRTPAWPVVAALGGSVVLLVLSVLLT